MLLLQLIVRESAFRQKEVRADFAGDHGERESIESHSLAGRLRGWHVANLPSAIVFLVGTLLLGLKRATIPAPKRPVVGHKWDQVHDYRYLWSQ